MNKVIWGIVLITLASINLGIWARDKGEGGSWFNLAIVPFPLSAGIFVLISHLIKGGIK